MNVGFAKLQMQNDVPGLSESAYGFGAGLFFFGYFFFEVPSNILLEKLGARLWIARIMISWGIISSAMLFVNSTALFYLIRFILGFAIPWLLPNGIRSAKWLDAQEKIFFEANLRADEHDRVHLSAISV